MIRMDMPSDDVPPAADPAVLLWMVGGMAAAVLLIALVWAIIWLLVGWRNE